jgi:arsenite/tail-anchored protein-transporting ATPase
VVNRVLPSDLAKQDIPPYLKNRLSMQGEYIRKIDQMFGRDVIGRVPEMERDVTGLPMIEKLAGIMYGNGKN